jgi:hypothetical protein
MHTYDEDGGEWYSWKPLLAPLKVDPGVGPASSPPVHRVPLLFLVVDFFMFTERFSLQYGVIVCACCDLEHC